MRIQAANMSFLWKVAGLSLRDRVRILTIQRELGVEPSNQKESAERLKHLIRIATCSPPFEGFLGTSNWEEALRQTQNCLAG